jgi:hypothetical protein
MFRLRGPSEPDLFPAAPVCVSKFEILKFLAIEELCLAIYLILLGAGTTLLHLPDDISTNLLSKI